MSNRRPNADILLSESAEQSNPGIDLSVERYLNDEFDCTNDAELLLLPSHYCIIDTELFAMKVTLDFW